MIGELSEDQLEHRLYLEAVGRIGCHAEGRTYIVPIAYVYDGEAIYAYTFEGQKLRMMRENPEVCFQVDHFDTLASWESVIIQGRFEELSGEEADAARRRIAYHFRSHQMPWLTHPPQVAGEAEWARDLTSVPVVYRIVPLEKTSRFERPEPARRGVLTRGERSRRR